jgi:hypothetical protein
MEPISRIKLEIAFEGGAEYGDANRATGKKPTICVIDLHGLKRRVWASSFPPPADMSSSLKDGKLKWNVAHTSRSWSDKLVNQISLTPDSARLMNFTAMVYTPGKYRESTISNVPITIVDPPAFEPGESYLIQIQNIGERSLKASFVKLGEERA